MKTPVWILAGLITMLLSTVALSGESTHEKKLIVVKAGDAEVIEADVSDLALGESRSFVTSEGQTIDLLKSSEGLEIYIDGELQETDLEKLAGYEPSMHLHEASEHEIECVGDESESDCVTTFVTALTGETSQDDQVKVIRKHIEVSCDDENECEEHIWVTKGDDLTSEDIHGSTHDSKVIIIRKEIDKVVED